MSSTSLSDDVDMAATNGSTLTADGVAVPAGDANDIATAAVPTPYSHVVANDPRMSFESGKPTTASMINAAQTAMKNSRPAKGPKVGVSLLATTGKVYTACAVGSGSMGDVCAERGAILKAITEGDTSFEVLHSRFRHGECLLGRAARPPDTLFVPLPAFAPLL